MRFLIVFLGFAAVSCAHSADGKGPSHSLVFTLTQREIAAIEPKGDIGREKFERGKWGSFEIRIPKELFPIPAPHCKKNVLLRIPGVDPDEPDSRKKLDMRWELFQSLYAVKEGKRASIEVPIEIRHSPGFAPYMLVDKTGNPTLEWCNAYIDAKAMESKLSAPNP